MEKSKKTLLIILCCFIVGAAICCTGYLCTIKKPGEKALTSPSLDGALTERQPLVPVEPEAYFSYNETPAEGENFSMRDGIWQMGTPGDRFFSTERKELEAAGVIPDLEGKYHFTCGVLYNEAGAPEEITFNWKLTQVYPGCYTEDFLIAHVETEEFELSGVDEYAVYFGETTSRQAGVEIAAVGTVETEKCLTFRLGENWYRVYGSTEIPIKDVVAVMEHFLQHPVDPEIFEEEKGNEYTWTTLEECPDAFRGFYPTESELCPPLIPAASEVLLRNGVPVQLYCCYDAPADFPFCGWSIYAQDPDNEADQVVLENIAGDIADLTEADLEAYWERGVVLNQHVFAFTWGDYLITTGAGNRIGPHQVWQVIQEVKKKQAAE